MTVELAHVNGAPGLVARAGGAPISVMTLFVTAGRIEAIHLVANPEKLTAIPVAPAPE